MKSASSLALSKLLTSEDEEQHKALELFAKADTVAREVVLIGPLLLDEAVSARLYEAIQRWTGKSNPNDMGLSGTDWAYRIGLTAGLRLARALDGGER